MPPEDLPPLAPFPDLKPALQPVADVVAGEGPLLSSSQRKEFALVADSLQGRPLADDTSGAPQEGDFLITPDDKPAASASEAAPRMVLSEEPVSPAAFLDLPAGEPHRPGLSDEGFELKSLAAALTSSAIPRLGSEACFAPGEWSVATLVAPLVPEKKESARDAFMPGLDTTPILLPVPVAIELPSPAFITTTTDHSSAAEPEPASFLFQPAAFPPFPLARTAQPDFDEPLTFPVPVI